MLLVIPARGGSRRIPHKNIRPFLGFPIITYPIRVAKESGVFSQIVVSTDDDDIGQVARKAGAEVVARSGVAASDSASVESVLWEVMTRLAHDGPVACTFPTSVFTTPQHWAMAAAGLGNGVECVYSAVEYDHPIYRARDAEGWVFPEFRDSRTQDCPKAHHDAGQFYMVARVTDSILDLPSAPMLLARDRCWDIDEPEDWAIAEALYRRMHDDAR
jgi:N-acylneuraminate cytidylyltransferase